MDDDQLDKEEFFQKIVDLVSEDTVGDENSILADLGAALVLEYAPPDIHFKLDYEGTIESGKELYQTVLSELYDLVCIDSAKSPKFWVKELIEGDIRNFILGIVAVITTRYNVSLGIAIPVTALIIKRGIVNYCAQSKPPKPKHSARRILSSYKLSMRSQRKGFEERIAEELSIEQDDLHSDEFDEKTLLQDLLLQSPYKENIKIKSPRKKKN